MQLFLEARGPDTPLHHETILKAKTPVIAAFSKARRPDSPLHLGQQVAQAQVQCSRGGSDPIQSAPPPLILWTLDPTP